MGNFRGFIIIGLLLTGFLLWMEWERETAALRAPAAQPTTAASPADPGSAVPAPPVLDEVPTAPALPTDLSLPEVGPGPDSSTPTSRRIRIRSDVLDLEVDSLGVEIISADLLAYPVDRRVPEGPVRLLNRSPGALFVAQVGLSSNTDAAPSHQSLFQIDQDDWRLEPRQDRLEVPFLWRDDSGIEVRRVVILERGSYLVRIRDEVRNRSDRTWTASQYRQFQRTMPDRPSSWSFTNPEAYSFVGASWYSRANGFRKLGFDDFDGKPLSTQIEGGWAAMLQHYFMAAVIPDSSEQSLYSTRVLRPQNAPRRYLLLSQSPSFVVGPGANAEIGVGLYLGPKLQKRLSDIAPGLELTVDYGIFTILSKPLFWLLDAVHQVVRNWGLAIIFVTLFIKLLFYKLSEAQYRSMAKMRKLQPRLAALKERYGDDRQKMSMAMMELYKKEKINPLGGCLPILIQIPVFIALYWVLLESVELRQAPFMLWIQDLSAPDPYFVLPVINGAAMYLTQKLTPAPGMDPMQQRIFQTMPLIFAVLFAFFPSGLVLYWTVNGVLSLGQQWLIIKRVEGGAKV